MRYSTITILIGNFNEKTDKHKYYKEVDRSNHRIIINFRFTMINLKVKVLKNGHINTIGYGKGIDKAK